MKLGFKTLAFALSAALSLTTCSGAFAQQDENGQDIEIFNQDGEKVGQKQLKLRGGGNRGIQARAMLANGDGKIIIVDSDGKTREIDVSNASSIIVNQGVKSIMVDGEQQKQTFGKAIVIGPDGVRQEFELAPNENGNGGLGQWQQVEVQPMEASFMIGVNCSPVSGVLAAQLQLESGTGLIIDRVSQGSPSESAGILQHDILMFVDDTQLKSVKQLSELVQTAGKEKTSLSLSLIRAGKEKSIDVSPVERPANELGGFGGGPIQLQFRQLGPGAIIDGPMMDENLHLQIKEQMKLMREQMQQMRQDFDRKFDAPGGGGGEDF